MRHLYRWSGMYTLFYVGHRLCRSRTGIYNIYLLEQDYQKENERKGSFLLAINWLIVRGGVYHLAVESHSPDIAEASWRARIFHQNVP